MSPEVSNSSFHSIPRLSASGLERYASCQAAWARENEVHDFCREMGIERPDDSSNVSRRGVALHKVLAEIPFHSAKYGYGQKVNLWSEIASIAAKKQVDLKAGEQWFLHKAIQRRNSASEAVFGMAHLPIKSVEISLDEERFTHKFGKVEFSGQGDVVVVVTDARGVKFGGIFDFKTGWSACVDAEKNQQLKGLSVLLLLNKGVDFVLCGLIEQARIKEQQKVVAYDAAALKRSVKDVEKVVVEAEKLIGAKSEDLDKQATPGDHCVFCKGKVACVRLRADLAERTMRAEEKLSDVFPIHEQISKLNRKAGRAALVEKEKLREEIEVLKGKKDDMIKSDLVKTLVHVHDISTRATLITALKKDVDDLTRAIVEKHPMQGVNLVAGRSMFILNESLTPEKQSPQEIYNATKEALKKAGREKDCPTYDQFVYACASVGATDVRDYLTDLLKSQKDEVVNIYGAMGDAAPFVKREGAKVVEVSETLIHDVLVGKEPVLDELETETVKA